LLVLFVVAKLLKDKGFGKSAMTVGGMGLLAAISAGGYQWVPAAQAGGPAPAPVSVTNSTANSSHVVATGTNVYTNNSGVTLKVISITGCLSPITVTMEPLCTANLSVPTATSCELTCM